ncbi:hypothetical protein T484DRAFT_1855312 [Baffinella frigidus]|nr:hypothetical protein T484DRAFT_1855312 [Cryptophyta sp. CCMP2293]
MTRSLKEAEAPLELVRGAGVGMADMARSLKEAEAARTELLAEGQKLMDQKQEAEAARAELLDEGQQLMDRKQGVGVADMALSLKEAEAAWAELLAEGQKLMDQKQKQEEVSRGLRKRIKELEAHAEGMNQQLVTEAGRIRSFEERLEMAQQQVHAKDEAVRLLRASETEAKALLAGAREGRDSAAADAFVHAKDEAAPHVHTKDEAVRLLRASEADARALLAGAEKELEGTKKRLERLEEAVPKGGSDTLARPAVTEGGSDRDALARRVAEAEEDARALAVTKGGSDRDALARRVAEAEEEARADANRQLERERKALEKETQAQVEMLTDSLESVQAGMRRLEQQTAPLCGAGMRRLEQQTSAREQRMRAEMEDLLQRCQEAEARAQELSSSVPEATRPLLRQIESLQASFADKAQVRSILALLYCALKSLT